MVSGEAPVLRRAQPQVEGLDPAAVFSHGPRVSGVSITNVFYDITGMACLGRTVSVAQPDNTGTTTYVYEGNAVTVTSQSGKWKKYSTDVLGSLVQVIEPDPALGNVQTNYTYNLRDQLTQVSMPRGGTTQTRTFNYDLATGRLTSATNPENGTVSYAYNTNGTLFSKTDAKSQRNEFSYDGFGRVTQKRGYGCLGCQPWLYVDFVYDSGVNAWGRLSSINLNAGGNSLTQSFTYTPAGLVTSKTQPDFGGAVTYTYDNEGRRVSTQYPFSGPTFTYTYDSMGRPIKLTDNQATPVDWVKDVAYNAAGQITTMSYARNPSGSSYYTETRQYNILQQLTRLTVPGVMDHEYRFSATQNDGRLTQRKDWVSGEEITYQYDSLNRLISAQTTGPEWGQSFGYDGFGSLLSQTVTKGSAPSMSVTVNPATNQITNTGTSYDANGNLTAMPGLTMTYDTDNRMLSNSSGDSYLYDAGGQRVRKKTNGQTTALYFYGVEGNLLHNWPSGYNVYFGKKLIYNSGGTVVTDRLGSVAQKDPTATRYFPYGDEPATTEQNRPKFATYFRDGTTALDYAQQRYYASTLGRFTSPDPCGRSGKLTDPQSWNRYSYTDNDPVNRNDPNGLFWGELWGAFRGFAEFLIDSFDGGGDWGYVASNGGSGGDPDPWDPCAYGSQWMPNPACYLPMIAFIAPPPPKLEPKEPECFAQLKYRPVDLPVVGSFATHAFWWVQTRTGSHSIVTAGPMMYEASANRYLEAWVEPGDSKGQDHSGQATAWSSGLSSLICDAVDRLIAAAKAFPRGSVLYNAKYGPNSNSAARYFGQAAGFSPSPPPGSVGWDSGAFGFAVPRRTEPVRRSR